MNNQIRAALTGLALISSTHLAVAETIVIAPEQETVIRAYVKKKPVASIDLPGVELTVGSTLPDTVELYPRKVVYVLD